VELSFAPRLPIGKTNLAAVRRTLCSLTTAYRSERWVEAYVRISSSEHEVEQWKEQSNYNMFDIIKSHPMSRPDASWASSHWGSQNSILTPPFKFMRKDQQITRFHQTWRSDRENTPLPMLLMNLAL
jgi:hypothetical protein